MAKAHTALCSLAARAAAVLITCMFAPCESRAAGDAVKGASLFAVECALCHTIGKGERNGFGPNLFGIADRKAGTAPGYKYSPAFLTMANWTWSPDGIASFIAAPAKTIPGNRMAVFEGVADKDLDHIIAYVAAQK